MTTNKPIITASNYHIIDEFNKLIEFIKIQIDLSPSKKVHTENLFRLKQIMNSLVVIKKYPHIIKAGSDLKDIKGIGAGTIRRIDEILQTGKLSEIKANKNKKLESVNITELEKVHGIGHAKAYDLVTKYGITNVKQLRDQYRAGKIELNDQILMGLKYYDIVKDNIPRVEIDEIYEYLKQLASNVNSKLNIIICGSYRRQKPVSGDIDILVTHPNIKTKKQIKSYESNYLIKFVDKLKKVKFIIDDLTDKDFRTKYMGYCKFKSNPVRRIDIRYVPSESYYTALLYFTGSGVFNQKMRFVAESMGYLLNEYGLYKLVGKRHIKIKVKSEGDVFKELGLEYLPPEKRN